MSGPGTENTSKAPLRVAILLPSAFPDLSYLERCLKADVILIDDISPFNRKCRVHRGLIRKPDGVQWIHIPVHPDGRKKPLYLARPAPVEEWFTTLWRTLTYSYRNSVFFEHYEPELKSDLLTAAESECYTDLTRHLNRRLWNYLELPEPAIPGLYLSDHGISSAEDLDLNHLLRGAETKGHIREYRSSQFQPGYGLGEEIPAFSDSWKRVVYRQHFEGFSSGCCALDLLFGEGPMAWKVTDKLM